VQLCEVTQPYVFWHGKKLVDAAFRGMRCASSDSAARALGGGSALALGREERKHTRTISDRHCCHAGASSLLRACSEA
jgi:hypothetical protein